MAVHRLAPRLERPVLAVVIDLGFARAHRPTDRTVVERRVVERRVVERRVVGRAVVERRSVAGAFANREPVVGRRGDPRLAVRRGAREALTDPCLDPLAGRLANEFALDLRHDGVDPGEVGGTVGGAVGLDGVFDPVGEEFVLFAPGALPEVVGDAGRDRLARGLLAALAGEEDERHRRMGVANRREEFEPVHPRHGVVAHDTVDRPRRALEPFERRRSRRLGRHVDAVEEAVEVGRPEVRDRALVVNPQHRDLVHRYGRMMPY